MPSLNTTTTTHPKGCAIFTWLNNKKQDATNLPDGSANTHGKTYRQTAKFSPPASIIDCQSYMVEMPFQKSPKKK